MRKTILLFAVATTLSCSVLQSVGRGVQSLYPGNGAVTQDELREKLINASTGFTVLVTEAADRISLETDKPKIRRLTLLWKIRIPPLAQQAAGDPNPRTGYVELLTVAVAQRQYFEEGGAGAAIFGSSQEIARDSAGRIVTYALKIGESFLPPAKLETLHGEVEAFAKQNPIRGEFLREGIAAGLAKAETLGIFNDIVSLPMAPFRAIAGVESGAQAIHEFNATASQFTEIIDQLPQRMRWQMELLSYDLQESGGVLDQSLKTFDSVAESADRLSLAAERAPQDMRDTIVSISDELEKRSATLKALLADYRAAIAETGNTTASVAPLVEGIARTSEQLNQAGVAWTALLAQINAPNPPLPPGATPPRPFDILDYERTATAVHSTAEELRALLGELKQNQGALPEAFADRLLRNGVVLIVVFFVALLGYRLIASRIAPSR